MVNLTEDHSAHETAGLARAVLTGTLAGELTSSMITVPCAAGDSGHPPVRIVAARLRVGCTEAYETAAGLLCEAELERASRMIAEGARAQFVLARALLRCLLGDRLGIAPQAVAFMTTLRGKPRLADDTAAADLRFNVSHSKDVALIATANGCDVGVDVECRGAIDHADAIAARFFSPVEYAALQSLNAADRGAGFLHCWTRKEAFIKAVGEGLYMPLDSFDVSLSPHEPARLIRVPFGYRDDWRVLSFRPFPDCVGAAVINLREVSGNAHSSRGPT